MKVATWNGCRDCPYLFFARPEDMWMCRHRQNNYDSEVPDPMDWVVAKENEDIPETPHPDCKLPDLPTQEDVEATKHRKISSNPYSDADTWYENGRSRV